MRRRRPFAFLPAVIAVVAAVSLAPARHAAADILTRVFLNGVPTPVYFNDGDSFRPKDGPYNGMQSRLGGFNTLESFGGAHQWGTWDPWELYAIAKEATLNGRRGTWHCFSDGTRDGYGRVLWDCPDLAISHIRAGLAHAYNASHDEEPSRFEYLRAQRDAVRNHRGMWAHGVPGFVMTSVHSADEGGSGHGPSYNRLISVADGHSESYEHHETYSECQRVCSTEVVVEQDRLDAVAMRMHADANVEQALGGMDGIHLEELVSMWARIGRLPKWTTDAQKAALTPWLTAVTQHGDFGTPQTRTGSCMIYVAFERRYGERRAACLRH